MYHPLSSIQFSDGIDHFTAEEHLLDRDNIIVKDGDSFLALKRTKTLAGLMKDVHDCPIIDEETYEIGYQTTMTLFYRTIENHDEMKQITFPYDPSVFNNYSIFHFIQMGSFPFLDDGIMYRVGDLRCYTMGSWAASSCLKSLVMGLVPMVGEVPVAGEAPVANEVPMAGEAPVANEVPAANPIQIPPIQIPVQIPVQLPVQILEPIENNPPNGGELNWPEEVVLE
jgi:hypothetical protein